MTVAEMPDTNCLPRAVAPPPLLAITQRPEAFPVYYTAVTILMLTLRFVQYHGLKWHCACAQRPSLNAGGCCLAFAFVVDGVAAPESPCHPPPPLSFPLADFMLDFCYFVQLLALVHIWVLPNK
jgi:hypothetical protein